MQRGRWREKERGIRAFGLGRSMQWPDHEQPTTVQPSEVHTTRFRYAFREQRPEDGITTAWVNLTFIDNNGRSAEVDVLLMTRAGMALRPAAGGSDNRSYATGCQRT